MKINLKLLWRLITSPDLSTVLDSYLTSEPVPQNALNIFEGQWASQLPEPFDLLKAGTAVLFDDPRIKWAEGELGGFKDRTILDLGPLEGGHPYMFERAGAREIISIEGNPRNFLKCLITKELMGLKRVSYQCGDFMQYLRANNSRFDIVNASGVLYHQRNPAELLALIANITDKLIMWTHYYDKDVVTANASHSLRFSPQPQEYNGFKYIPQRQEYKNSARLPSFCGGNAPYSHWMSREDMIRCLTYFGWGRIRISFEEPLHINGPCFNLVATRS